jgi:hypothetical protein
VFHVEQTDPDQAMLPRSSLRRAVRPRQISTTRKKLAPNPLTTRDEIRYIIPMETNMNSTIPADDMIVSYHGQVLVECIKNVGDYTVVRPVDGYGSDSTYRIRTSALLGVGRIARR